MLNQLYKDTNNFRNVGFSKQEVKAFEQLGITKECIAKTKHFSEINCRFALSGIKSECQRLPFQELLQVTFVYLASYTHEFLTCFGNIVHMHDVAMKSKVFLIEQLLTKVVAEVRANKVFLVDDEELWYRIREDIVIFDYKSLELKSRKKNEDKPKRPKNISFCPETFGQALQDINNKNVLKSFHLFLFEQECLAKNYTTVAQVFNKRNIPALFGFSSSAFSQHKANVLKAYCERMKDKEKKYSMLAKGTNLFCQQLSEWLINADKKTIQKIAHHAFSSGEKSDHEIVEQVNSKKTKEWTLYMILIDLQDKKG